MSFGLEVRDGSGEKTLSVTDRLTRLHSTVAVQCNMISWSHYSVPGMTPDGTWAALPHHVLVAMEVVSGGFRVIRRNDPNASQAVRELMLDSLVTIFRC